MALRLTALGRQAQLGGGVSDLFDGGGNQIEVVLKSATQSGDVDTVNAGATIVTLVGTTYAAPGDDGTTATAALSANIGPANAVSAHDYTDADDGIGVAEIFVGTGRTAGDKVGDLTVGGPGTSGSPDLVLSADEVVIGTQITITQLTLSS